MFHCRSTYCNVDHLFDYGNYLLIISPHLETVSGGNKNSLYNVVKTAFDVKAKCKKKVNSNVLIYMLTREVY